MSMAFRIEPTRSPALAVETTPRTSQRPLVYADANALPAPVDWAAVREHTRRRRIASV